MRYRLTTLVLVALSFLGGSGLAQSRLAISRLPEGAPLTVSATATDRSLVIEVALAPEWHLYGRDVGGGQPVTVRLDEDGDFVAAGSLEVPASTAGELTGSPRLVLPLRRTAPEAPAPRALRATLSFQVCDALECLEPMSVAITGEVAPLRVLLVVANAGERTDRITAWLGARGFAATVTTYETVSAEACEASDVVLADSDYFRLHGVGRDTIHRFPKTTTPLVAVGFIGTELVEAHGVAMTSGYI